MYNIAHTHNSPEGFTYTRCDGSIFEDISEEYITHDNDPAAQLGEDDNDSVAAEDNDHDEHEEG